MSVTQTDYFSFLAKFLLSLSACCTSLVSTIIEAPPARAEKALRLTQTHNVMGNSVMTFNSNGMRLENTSGLKYTVVAKAPDWRVTVFRNDDKSYYSQSLKEFEQAGLLSGFVLVIRDRNIVDKRNEKFRVTTFDFYGQKIVRMTGKEKMLKYMPLKQNVPELERLDYAIFKQPTNGGIAIGYQTTHGGRDYITGMNNAGRRQIHLETSKIEEIDVSPSFFKAPSGYKLAKSIGEVVTAANTRAEDADYQELFDSPRGSNTGKQSNTERQGNPSKQSNSNSQLKARSH
ncbi:hypothetical protein KBI23_13360 [bacterium]|nr:hypothetical protein [bacterium]MBP9807550.1 hypothetical protein [bacterium]